MYFFSDFLLGPLKEMYLSLTVIYVTVFFFFFDKKYVTSEKDFCVYIIY